MEALVYPTGRWAVYITCDQAFFFSQQGEGERDCVLFSPTPVRKENPA